MVTRCLEEGEVRWLGDIPAELLSTEEKELVSFILNYTRKNNATPSVKRVMEEFSWFIPFKFVPSAWEPSPPPLGDVHEQTIHRMLLNTSERILYDAMTTITRDGEVPLEMLREIDRLHTMSKGVYTFSTFDRDLYFRKKELDIPFKLINDQIGGMSKGDFLLLVGRLGTGKSTIAQWFAKCAWEQAKTVLFISAEMLAADVFARIDAMLGTFNPLMLRTGSNPEIEDLLDKAKKRAKSGKGEIIIPQSRLLSPAQIGAFAQNLNVDLIVIDGVYLLHPNEGKFGSMYERVRQVSNDVKQLALGLPVPIVGTAQIKRGVSGAGGYDPEDIAMSDALGQDSDFVGAIWPNETVKNRMEIQLIKNRFGGNVATQAYVDYDKMTVIDETVSGRVGEPVEKIKPSEWKGD